MGVDSKKDPARRKQDLDPAVSELAERALHALRPFLPQSAEGQPVQPIGLEKLLDAPLVSIPKISLDPPEGEGADVEIPVEFDFDSPYDVLGIPREATPEEAKEAAFALRRILERQAMQGNEAAGERLARVNRAMETLTKPEKKEEYDRKPDALFLAIHEPAPAERVSWIEGLRLIQEWTLGPGVEDPLEVFGGLADVLKEKPDPVLSELLASHMEPEKENP